MDINETYGPPDGQFLQNQFSLPHFRRLYKGKIRIFMTDGGFRGT